MGNPRADRFRTWFWLPWLLALGLGWWRFGGRVPFPFRALYSDYLLAHMPQVAYLRAMWKAGYGLALWFPGQLGGYPLYADPLSTPAYPPGWAAWLLPVPWGLNLMLALHMFWAALGMYRLLRYRGASTTWAWLLATWWMLLPKAWAHLAAGHLTLLYSLAWLPWTLLAALQRRWTWTGLTLALAGLADPRGGLLVLVALAVAWGSEARPGPRALLWVLLLSGLLTAPLALPLLGWLPQTLREASPKPVFPFDLTAALGLISPLFIGGEPERVSYFPLSLWLPALAVLVRDGRARQRRLGPLLQAVGLALALTAGLWSPWVPGLAQFRVPLRWLWLWNLGMVLTAGRWRPGDEPSPAFRRLAFGLWMWGLLQAAAWFALLRTRVPLSLPWVDALVLLDLVGTGLWFWQASRKTAGPWPRMPFAGALVVPLMGLVFLGGFVRFRPLGDVEPAGRRVLAHLPLPGGKQPWLRPRLLDLTFSLLPWRAVLAEVPMAHGVHPLYSRAYDTAVHQALGWQRPAYSVTVPYFFPQQPQSRPNLTALARLRVGYLISPRPLPEAAAGQGLRLSLVHDDGAAWVYRLSPTCPPAWVEPPDGPADCFRQPAQVRSWTPNQVVLEAQGPGRLVWAENGYPDWQVWVDGKPARPIQVGPWRAVDLPPGTHRVRWRLVPRRLYLGWSLALLAAGLVLLRRGRLRGF